MAKNKSSFSKFWKKLPKSQRIGLVFFIIALVGAAAAFILSRTDQSLQSKASAECNSNCQVTCRRLDTTDTQEQFGKCISNCQNKCNLVKDTAEHEFCHSPVTSRFYFATTKRKLSDLSFNWVKKVFSSQNIDVKTQEEFKNWFELYCQPEEKEPLKCQPNWSAVLDTRVPNADGSERTLLAQGLFWPNGCKGTPPSSDMGCTQAQVPLTDLEIKYYEKWVAAGRPAIESKCGGGTTKPVVRPDISWKTCLAQEKYVILETYPATCEVTNKDSKYFGKIAFLGDIGLPDSGHMCPEIDLACPEGTLKATNIPNAVNEEEFCPVYKCIGAPVIELLTWEKCIKDPSSEIIDTVYPPVCKLDDQKVQMPELDDAVIPPTSTKCDSDVDCPTQYYCYQPSMPVCPEGQACAQVMPDKVCVPDRYSSHCWTIENIQCVQAPCDPIEVCARTTSTSRTTSDSNSQN